MADVDGYYYQECRVADIMPIHIQTIKCIWQYNMTKITNNMTKNKTKLKIHQKNKTEIKIHYEDNL